MELNEKVRSIKAFMAKHERVIDKLVDVVLAVVIGTAFGIVWVVMLTGRL